MKTISFNGAGSGSMPISAVSPLVDSVNVKQPFSENLSFTPDASPKIIEQAEGNFTKAATTGMQKAKELGFTMQNVLSNTNLLIVAAGLAVLISLIFKRK